MKGKEPSLPELPIQYADFTYWQRKWLEKDLGSHIDYWKQKLAELPPLLELPIDKPRPAIQTYNGANFSLQIDKKLSDSVKNLSLNEGLTLYMTLLSAFQVLLHRYSNQESIVVGTAIANRNRKDIENIIGFFVNMLAIRSDLSEEITIKELLMQVRNTTLEAYAHQDLPFEKLVQILNPERSLSYSPIFQAMFSGAIFAEVNIKKEPLIFPGVDIESSEFEIITSKFDLTFYLSENSEGLYLAIEYNTDLFYPETISRMANHYKNLLESIVKDPDQKVSEISFLSEQEKHKLLVEWDNTKTDYPKNKCIHELFEEQVKKTPDNIAVVFEDHKLTYKELNEKANQLARYLKAVGVKPESLVGICAERSLKMIIGILGILKAGGAYIPINPEYPKERIKFILMVLIQI